MAHLAAEVLVARLAEWGVDTERIRFAIATTLFQDGIQQLST